MSSMCRNSRRSVPVPHTVTAGAPASFASWNRRIRPGTRWESSGWKLSPGPYRFVGMAEMYCTVLTDWLGSQLGTDAARTQERQLGSPVSRGRVEHVHLHSQVVGDEVGGIGAVRQDAADFGRCHQDCRRPLRLEERLHRVAIAEVQLGRGPCQKRRETHIPEVSQDCAADKSPVSGDVRRAPLSTGAIRMDTRLRSALC